MILFPPLISLIILLIIFCGALVGMLIARRLPEQHLSGETKAVITTSMAVVGTMSALVISLLISSANTSFSARNAEVAQLSTDIIRMNSLLVRYGPAADPARQALQEYAAMTYRDLFARREGRKTTVENASTDKVLEQIQDRILNLKSADSRQQWLASQALQLAADVSAARWLLVQEEVSSFPLPFLGAVILWLTVLFASYGLFAPRNVTALVAIFLCAFAVAAAVKLILDMDTPFAGGIRLSAPPIRISSDPIRHAIELLGK
jgi:hypothetical protein